MGRPRSVIVIVATASARRASALLLTLSSRSVAFMAQIVSDITTCRYISRRRGCDALIAAAQVWRIDMPPSTGMIAPLTKLDAGRQRLSVMCATSSGSP